MPTEQWLVKWKKNRNNRGREIVFSQKKAVELAEQKRQAGFKVKLMKLPRSHPQYE